MAERELEVTCTCGWSVRGDEPTVVTETQAHVQKVHWTDIEPEDVLEMATPVD